MNLLKLNVRYTQPTTPGVVIPGDPGTAVDTEIHVNEDDIVQFFSDYSNKTFSVMSLLGLPALIRVLETPQAILAKLEGSIVKSTASLSLAQSGDFSGAPGAAFETDIWFRPSRLAYVQPDYTNTSRCVALFQDRRGLLLLESLSAILTKVNAA